MGVLVGDDGGVMDVVRIDCTIIDFSVGHRIVVVIDGAVVRSGVVEHLVDGFQRLGELFLVGKTDEYHQVGEHHLFVSFQMDMGRQMEILGWARRQKPRSRVCRCGKAEKHNRIEQQDKKSFHNFYNS